MQADFRVRIIQYLHRINSPASAKEISIALNSSKSNIQYHIKFLLESGKIVQHFSSQESHPRGRPEIRYKLPPLKRPDNILHFTDVVLGEATSTLYPTTTLEMFLRNMADKMFPPSIPSETIAETLNQMIKKLNEHQYDCRWEVHQQGPRIFFKNCPYMGLLRSHPELCSLDQSILENHSLMIVKQISRIDDNKPRSCCTFQLQAQTKPKAAISS
jgi:predicted ArsR family transcriptional regulator